MEGKKRLLCSLIRWGRSLEKGLEWRDPNSGSFIGLIQVGYREVFAGLRRAGISPDALKRDGLNRILSGKTQKTEGLWLLGLIFFTRSSSSWLRRIISISGGIRAEWNFWKRQSRHVFDVRPAGATSTPNIPVYLRLAIASCALQRSTWLGNVMQERVQETKMPPDKWYKGETGGATVRVIVVAWSHRMTELRYVQTLFPLDWLVIRTGTAKMHHSKQYSIV